MSVMSSQRRKLFVGPKPSNKDRVKGDHMKWLNGAKAQLDKLFNVDRYLKHRTRGQIITLQTLIRENRP